MTTGATPGVAPLPPGITTTAMLFVRLALFAFLVLIGAADAAAHTRRASLGDLSGITIPSLSHGEMAVLSPYRSEIMGLADGVLRQDDTLRRLQTYAAIQYSYCMWGALPGTISDEESPFNECAHAYLAATKALLLHMRGMAEGHAPAGALASEISFQMARTGAALIGCEYSGEAFNTAEYITPRWERLPTHLPTLASFGAVGLMLLAAVGARRVMGRRMATADEDAAGLSLAAGQLEIPSTDKSSARSTG